MFNSRGKDDYRIAIITALPIERAAVRAMLDSEHEQPYNFRQHQADPNSYSWGTIGQQNVVITSLPAGVYGVTSATTTVIPLRYAFPQIKWGLMIGIAAGIPSQDRDIRLGDVVVSQPIGNSGGVFQYDLVKVIENRWQRLDWLARPPEMLLRALANLQADHEFKGPYRAQQYLREAILRHKHWAKTYAPPLVATDRLFFPSYHHQSTFKDCRACEIAHEIVRPPRESSDFQVHYGVIGSGNSLVKNPWFRDQIAATVDHCICLEMEAAGLMNDFPCLVVRGICDYADSHKNDVWQRYASATAAAFAKEFLTFVYMVDSSNDHYPHAPMLSSLNVHAKDDQTAIPETYINTIPHISSGSVPSESLSHHEKSVSGTQDKDSYTILTYLYPSSVPGTWPEDSLDAVENAPDIQDKDDNTAITETYFDAVNAIYTEDIPSQSYKQSEDLISSIQDRKEHTSTIENRPSTVSETGIQNTPDELHVNPDEPADDVASIDDQTTIDDTSSPTMIGINADISPANLHMPSEKPDSGMQETDNPDHTAELLSSSLIDVGIENSPDQLPNQIEETKSGIRATDNTEHTKDIDLNTSTGIQINYTPDETQHQSEEPAAFTTDGGNEYLNIIKNQLSNNRTIYEPQNQPENPTPLSIRDEHNTAAEAHSNVAPGACTNEKMPSGLQTRSEGFDEVEISIPSNLEPQSQPSHQPDLELGSFEQLHTDVPIPHAKPINQVSSEQPPRMSQNPVQIVTTPPSLPNQQATILPECIAGSDPLGRLPIYDSVPETTPVNVPSSSHEGIKPVTTTVTVSPSITTDAIPSPRPDTINQSFSNNRPLDDIPPKPTEAIENLNKELLSAAEVGDLAQVESLIGRGAELNFVRAIDGITVLHQAAKFGHENVLLFCLDHNVSIETTSRTKSTALYYAAINSQWQIVRLLLDRGADFTAKNNYDRNILHAAAVSGELRIIQLLIDRKVDLEAKDRDGETPLHKATTKGHARATSLLLDCNANIEASNKKGDTALHLTIQFKSKKLIKLLLARAADPTVKNNLGISFFHAAIRNADIDTIKIILSRQINLEVKDNDGNTALHLTILQDLAEVTTLLLDRGANIEAKNNAGDTALHLALQSKSIVLIKLLLAHGADTGANNKLGYNALHVAVSGDDAHTNILELILNHQIDLDSKGTDGKAALHVAAENNHKEIAILLLARKANIEAIDNNGNTALLLAINKCHPQLVSLLLERNSDLKAKTKDGNTGLHLAIEQNHRDIAATLLKHNADIEAKNDQGETPLHRAARLGHSRLVKMLLKQKANTESRNDKKRTPLHLAALNGSTRTVKFLLDAGADSDAEDELGRRPFRFAKIQGHTEVMQLLEERGGGPQRILSRLFSKP